MRSLPFQRIVRTALPLYATMVVASAAALIDAVLLARHATASLAAFAVTIAVYSPAVATVNGVLRGVMPFVAQYRDQPRDLAQLIRNGSGLGLLTGLLGAIVVACVPFIGRAIGVPEATISGLGVFPLFLAGAVLAISVGASAISILVGLGYGKQVMRAGMAGTGCAVVLSLVLIGGPGPLPSIGITGAGVAMLASSLTTAVWAQRALRRVPELAGTVLTPGRPDPAAMLKLAKVGLPLAATVLMKFVVLGVLTFAAARLGTEQAAVHGASESLVNFVYTAAVAIGQAAVPVVAESVRSGDVSGARRGLVTAATVTAAVIGGMGAIVVLGGHWLVPLISDDVALQPQLESLLPLVALAVVADALQAVFGFGLLGLRRTLPSLMTTAVFFGALCLVAVPVAEAGGLSALWIALICANGLQAVAKALLFLRISSRASRTE